MANTTLTLGPIVFQDFEVPCAINFGGKQRLAVHRLPGGARVIDALGRDDAEIIFSGIFSGNDATLRARLLDEMRASGALLPLTWDVFFYTAVIAQFEANYSTRNWIPYKIVCTILRDEASVLLQAAVSLGTSILNDVGVAINLAMSGGVDISSLQSTISDTSATVRNTAAYNAAQSGIAAVQSNLTTAIGTASTVLPVDAITSSGSANSGVTSLTTAVGASQQLSQLTIAQSYVGRVATNLANAST